VFPLSVCSIIVVTNIVYVFGCVSFVVYLVHFSFVTLHVIVGLATENHSEWTTEWTILDNSLLY